MENWEVTQKENTFIVTLEDGSTDTYEAPKEFADGWFLARNWFVEVIVPRTVGVSFTN
jgi:hypothetical protein